MRLQSAFLLGLLGACNGALFSVPYLKYSFFQPMMDNMRATGQELGLLLTVFAVACVALLGPGGVLADRLNVKWSIVGSLIATGLLALVFAFTFTSRAANVAVWAGLAVSTIFLAWPSLMKAVRLVAPDRAGTAYTVYYASSGLTAAAIAWIALDVYTRGLAHGPAAAAFTRSILVLALFCFLLAGALWAALRVSSGALDAGARARHTKQEVWAVLRLPSLWQTAAILFCAYSLYIGISFFTPYLSFSLGLSDRVSGRLAIIRSFVFLAMTPLVGVAADRLFRSTLRLFEYAAPPLALLFLGLCALDVTGAGSAPVRIGLTMLAAFLACGLYASMFSIVSEGGYPAAMTGMVVGFVSVASYTPDIVLQPLFGRFVDHARYPLLLLILAVLAALAGLSARRLRLRILREKAALPEAAAPDPLPGPAKDSPRSGPSPLGGA